jgi:hypothetical protein
MLRNSSARSRHPRIGFILPCNPTLVDRPPAGPNWLHEIKYDGYLHSGLEAGLAGSLMEQRSGSCYTSGNGRQWLIYQAQESGVRPDVNMGAG